MVYHLTAEWFEKDKVFGTGLQIILQYYSKTVRLIPISILKIKDNSNYTCDVSYGTAQENE